MEAARRRSAVGENEPACEGIGDGEWPESVGERVDDERIETAREVSGTSGAAAMRWGAHCSGLGLGLEPWLGLGRKGDRGLGRRVDRLAASGHALGGTALDEAEPWGGHAALVLAAAASAAAGRLRFVEVVRVDDGIARAPGTLDVAAKGARGDAATGLIGVVKHDVAAVNRACAKDATR